MKHIHLLCLLLASFCYTQMSAQCDHTLVEKAAAQSGPGAVYLREFKVKFDGSERGKAVPVAKYPVLLSKNMTYRFNVCNSEEYPGRVILQLYLKDKLIGSTFDTRTSTDLQRFDVTCPKAATYEIVMSFDQGKPGCAVGILSLLPETEAISQEEELDILYALADNPVTIYDDEDEFADIEVSIDNGSVVNIEKTNYIIRPEKAGMALLSIRVLHRDGSLKEFKQKKFAVLALDKPYVSIRGLMGGQISREELIRFGRLELWFSEDMKCHHRVTSFVMSDKSDFISGITSTSGRFSRAQRDWLQSLPSGTRIYIKNIRVQTSGHTVMDIDPIDFIIE